jgi:hypothetical protein
MLIATAKTLFNVDGDVEVIVFGKVKTAVESSGGLTAEVGIAGNTAAIIAQTGKAHLAADKPWVDASQANPHALPAAVMIASGANIILTTGTADADVGGEIEMTCLWKPISSDGKVAAA